MYTLTYIAKKSIVEHVIHSQIAFFKFREHDVQNLKLAILIIEYGCNPKTEIENVICQSYHVYEINSMYINSDFII